MKDKWRRGTIHVGSRVRLNPATIPPPHDFMLFAFNGLVVKQSKFAFTVFLTNNIRVVAHLRNWILIKD
jgi:hypothetical protein